MYPTCVCVDLFSLCCLFSLSHFMCVGVVFTIAWKGKSAAQCLWAESQTFRADLQSIAW